MFLGEYQPNITEGSRLALPKKIREEIKGRFVVLSRGFEQCVFGYKKEDWEKEAEKYTKEPVSDKKARFLRRYMYSGAEIINLDSQGRLVLSQSLKEYAGIKDSVVVIGAGDHFEIWDFKYWKTYLAQLEDDVNE